MPLRPAARDPGQSAAGHAPSGGHWRAGDASARGRVTCRAPPGESRPDPSTADATAAPCGRAIPAA